MIPSRIHQTVRALEPWGVLLAAFGIILATMSYCSDLDDRRYQREIDAWQLLTAPAFGNSGKREAIEYLHGLGVEFRHINLSPPNNGTPPDDYVGRPFFRGVRLPGANLMHANLLLTTFREANLQGANLQWAHLDRAKFTEVDLRGTKFIKTDLDLADFRGAKRIEEAIFDDVTLRGANLRDTAITEEQLETSCGDSDTMLPRSVSSIRNCPQTNAER